MTEIVFVLATSIGGLVASSLLVSRFARYMERGFIPALVGTVAITGLGFGGAAIPAAVLAIITS